jgi:hypothetical protein
MKIFPLTIYVLLKPFIQILPSDSKKSLWDSRTTATLVNGQTHRAQTEGLEILEYMPTNQDHVNDYNFYIDVGIAPVKNVLEFGNGNRYDKGHLYPNFMASYQFPGDNQETTNAR